MKTREQWLSERLTGIGASEAAAVLGVSPWASRFSVWAEKTGAAVRPDVPSERMRWGLRLEAPIMAEFHERTGREVSLWPQHEIARHPVHNFMIATPDGYQTDPDRGGMGLVQIKNADALQFRNWDEFAPLVYQIQCQHEMAVVGAAYSDLVVLVGGNSLKVFPMERDERFLAQLIPALAEFWKLVETKQPPEIDGTEATTAAIKAIYPEDDGETVVLPEESQAWTDELLEFRAKVKDLEGLIANRENAIKAAIGTGSYGLLPDGSRWSWKQQTRAAHVVAESTFRVLRKCK